MRPIHILIICILTVFTCCACSAGEPYVVLKGERFTVEIADTQQKQALGLMFRDELADDRGMVFIFPGEARRAFWMKNCRIPLDIFYFDSDLKLVSVSENTPPCNQSRCPSYPSDGPAQYVLELNAGKAEELGVEVGDSLELHLD